MYYHCIPCGKTFTPEETEVESLFGNESVALCPICMAVAEWREDEPDEPFQWPAEFGEPVG